MIALRSPGRGLFGSIYSLLSACETWAMRSLLLLLGSHLVLPRSALKPTAGYPGYVIKPAALESLHQTAYLMAQERLNMREGANPLLKSLFISPSFSIVFSQELDRLQDNFNALNSDNHRLLVAVAAANKTVAIDTVLGYIDVDNRPKVREKLKDGVGPYVSDLVCTASWRRKGVASALLYAAEDICAEWAETCMHLLVDTTNVPAIRLYERVGYAPVRVEREVEVEEVVEQQGEADGVGEGRGKGLRGYQAAQAIDRDMWVVEKEGERMQTQTYAELCAAVYKGEPGNPINPSNPTNPGKTGDSGDPGNPLSLPLEDEAFLAALTAYQTVVMKKLL
jgi:ribosomal protein S18 acetylase RimI-like enzyme